MKESLEDTNSVSSFKQNNDWNQDQEHSERKLSIYGKDYP